LFAALVAVLVLCAGWVAWELQTPYYGAPTAETFVSIPRGAGPAAIAGRLVDAGVLHARLPFLLYVRWSHSDRHMQAGQYRFTAPATPRQLAERLVRGDIYYVTITIPEGLTAQETVERLASARLGERSALESGLRRTDWIRDLDPDAQSLEGYLFPETYRFPHGITSEEILRAMVDEFRTRFAKITQTHPLPRGWTVSQIVILASMVEKEVKIPPERPLVASVLVNRLQRGMLLACDPTVIYALKVAGRYDGMIHKTDLGIVSPYNTYTSPGLPPGPIANPGEASLTAALDPQKTDYLYFVSRNDGTHEFSRDFRSHLAAVARFQKPLSVRRSVVSRNKH
jgi:UPF0755 protein